MARNHWVGIAVIVQFACTAWHVAPAQSVPPMSKPGPLEAGQPFRLLPNETRMTLHDAGFSSGTAPQAVSLFGTGPGFGNAGQRSPFPRHRGIGVPLERTSWRNRPWFAGWLVGQLYGDDLVDGRVHQHSALTGGYWIGYDMSHYWGAEMEWAFAYPRLTDSVWSIPRSSRDVFWDFDLLYYPWGDARYRPYFKAGFGVTGVHFEDEQGRFFNRGLVTFPLGMGVKYYWKRWLALRLDLTDRIAIGSGRVASMHNWSLVGGVEWRFGARSHVIYRP